MLVAFIRRKQVNGATYYSLVESVRANRRVRQRVIVSLGQCATIDEALDLEIWWAKEWKRLAEIGFKGMTNARYLFQTSDGDVVCLPVGEPAQLRATKCEKKIQLLRHWRDVMSKAGTESSTV